MPAFALVAGMAFAQTGAALLDKAPPDVDNALRSSVLRFYELHKERKYRTAEELVCADSKDEFYNSEKRPVRNAEIIAIRYEAGFRQARVSTQVGTDLSTQYGKMSTSLPLPSNWRVDAGKWCLYYPPVSEAGLETPFGVMRPGGGPGPSASGQVPAMLGMGVVQGTIDVNPRGIDFTSGEPGSVAVTIKNGFTGPISIEIEAREHPNLVFALDKPDIPAGASGTLTVRYAPRDPTAAREHRIVLRPSPFSRSLTILVSMPAPVKRP
jgi:hypothetical protein